MRGSSLIDTKHPVNENKIFANIEYLEILFNFAIE
jgi:hypothetical protein